MKFPIALKKLVAKPRDRGGDNPMVGMLIRFGKIVATDSFKLIELSTDEFINVNKIVPIKQLSNGDFIKESGDKIVSASKDRGIQTDLPTTDGKDYPKYESIFDRLEKEYTTKNSASFLVNRKYLIDLLSAFPEPHIMLQVPMAKNEAMLLTGGEKSRGLIMPINR